ncbi:MAG: FtsX-like permease family protein [Clostridiales bacterium]|uniref:FtsX-like permease family protein n=1 Tax=Terrisporobacter sp. TaxID=1965305 RepID=UPI002A562C81|nr:FtsX-like permease family protein [Terrisporobacter sp.]MDD7753500.1 FtsX-like permease family protein [Clostridiales bacterium]MDY4136182.1 FtsX-like permease family protein [Terrisporobacter sp.]
MRSALNKDFIRDILKSKGRFLSIVAIVALGVAFFTGVKSSPIVMKTSSDKYYDKYNLMDIRLISTLGLTDKDVDDIKNIEGVEGVYPTYSIDVISIYNSTEKVLKVHGLDLNKLNDKKNYINQLKLIKGRLPQKSGECVLEIPKIKALNYPIGSEISLSSGKDDKLSKSLSKSKYKVVGYVETPYYLSQEKGNSSIGGGVIEGAIMIPESDFKMDTYTEMFLTVKSAKELDTYGDEYSNLVKTVTDKIENMKNKLTTRRYNEVVKKAEDKIQKQEDKLSKAKKDFDKGKKEYEENKLKSENEIKEAENKILDASEQIEDGKAQLKNEKKRAFEQIEEGKIKLANAETDLKNGQKKYQTALKKFNSNKKTAESEIKKAESDLEELSNQIDDLKNGNKLIEKQLQNEQLSEVERSELENKLNENLYILSVMQQKYKDGTDKLESSKSELLLGEKKLKETKATLEASEKKIANEKTKLKSSEKLAEEKFKKAEEELYQRENQIEEAKLELKENKAKLKTELNKAKKELQEAEEKIADGEEKIKDAKKQIKKIEKPTLYILDRDSHQSFVEYEGCANSIDALAKIFPVFFFAVAALVCLTTMTRMVDEQRINIGTLKGLGYKTSQISKKYILYALIACLTGSILGLAIGFSVFPTVIFFAYGMMYSIENIVYVFSIPIAIGITSLALIIIILSAYMACRKELKETPAILMRPKAPKSGKRILLERVPFIWNRFSFISKVTVRNIFRYKKRFLMTVLGIAGCTALILTGFGIKDSIEMILTGQYGTLFKYDMSLVIQSDMTDKQIYELRKNLSDIDEINKYEFFSYENGDIKVNNTTKEITIVVPENLKKMDKFIHLQDRKTQNPIELNNKGIVLTEKIARDLGVKAGDEIELINSDDKKAKIKVSHITENYISHYVYISPENYTKLFEKDLDFNRVIGILNNPSVKIEDKLSKKLFDIDTIDGITFNTASKETFHNTIKNLNYVVLIMIISAGALAFVVLYNLTNVNISERIREIATIKVLGFYDKEVSAYIYRENIILTIIGTVVGLGLGTILHKFIMVTVEIQSMMFGRVIDISSYFIAAVLTIVLSLFVNLAMFYKLRNVKMVESLKSVD